MYAHPHIRTKILIRTCIKILIINQNFVKKYFINIKLFNKSKKFEKIKLKTIIKTINFDIYVQNVQKFSKVLTSCTNKIYVTKYV